MGVPIEYCQSHNFCTLYDEAPERNQKLFYVICKQLSSMGIIESEDFIDELSSVRSSYKRAFRDLVMQAMMAINEEESTQRRLPAPGDEMQDPPRDSFAIATRQTLASRLRASIPSPSQFPNTGTLSPASDFFGVLDVRSRYREDFIEVRPLGKGAFGQVTHVRNRLDGVSYAVKRIRLRVGRRMGLDKILREVKFQARLAHPNVVRYYSAWLEHAEPAAFSRKGKSGRSTDGDAFDSTTGYSYTRSGSESGTEPDGRIFELLSGDEEESDRDTGVEIEFVNSESEGEIGREDLSREDSGGSLATDEGESDSDGYADDRDNNYNDDLSNTSPTTHKNACSHRSVASSHSSSPRDLTLFIQMELCGFTLQDWLVERNAQVMSERARRGGADDLNDVNARECLAIFRDLVEGLEYIHRMGCIHRDIKPKNIYWQPDDGDGACASVFCPGKLGKGKWKIGDFGLVTTAEMMEPAPTTASESEPEDVPTRVRTSVPPDPDRTLGVGTVTYASPEQLSSRNYTARSDMYSLGILLFELLHPCGTGMERAEAIKGLRSGVVPDDFLKKWPKEATLVLWLTQRDANQRPSAQQVLEFELLKQAAMAAPHDVIAGKTDDSLGIKTADLKASEALAVPPTDSRQSTESTRSEDTNLARSYEEQSTSLESERVPSQDLPAYTSAHTRHKHRKRLRPVLKALRTAAGVFSGNGPSCAPQHSSRKDSESALALENEKLKRRIEELERMLKDGSESGPGNKDVRNGTRDSL
ncbi:Eukaryotic translation initiation factor 2-alpha kinase [Borealophlyctis nickersoniae]|nr:Eukaryotic translation initiation factor 2-alpha kinase [Borealophlyctis nickersoniae]